MKKGLINLFLICLVLLIGCSDKPQPVEKQPAKDEPADVAQAKKNPLTGKPVMALADITESFQSFWSYFNTYALLHRDYPTFDEMGKSITKGLFLSRVNTGLFIPMVVYGDNGNVFKLAKIPARAPKEIGFTLIDFARREIINYKMEGKPVPKFNMTDINGNNYTSENTKGKIVLFKCWFISCVACIAEMPALNELVHRYKDRKDILFISLAMDAKAPLQRFLTKTKFDYATVPNQTEYMDKQLNVQLYPTHFIINKEGILVKVLPDVAEVDRYLEQEAAKN